MHFLKINLFEKEIRIMKKKIKYLQDKAKQIEEYIIKYDDNFLGLAFLLMLIDMFGALTVVVNLPKNPSTLVTSLFFLGIFIPFFVALYIMCVLDVEKRKR